MDIDADYRGAYFRDDRFLDISDRHAQLLGFANATETVGRRMIESPHLARMPRLQQAIDLHRSKLSRDGVVHQTFWVWLSTGWELIDLVSEAYYKDYIYDTVRIVTDDCAYLDWVRSLDVENGVLHLTPINIDATINAIEMEILRVWMRGFPVAALSPSLAGSQEEIERASDRLTALYSSTFGFDALDDPEKARDRLRLAGMDDFLQANHDWLRLNAKKGVS